MTKPPSNFRASLTAALALAGFAAGLSLASCDNRGSSEGIAAMVAGRGGSSASGSGGSGGTRGPAGMTPAMQCRRLLIALCAKDTTCGTFDALSDEECIAQFTSTDCSTISGVSDTYDACLRDIAAAACPFTNNFPESCRGVLIK